MRQHQKLAFFLTLLSWTIFNCGVVAQDLQSHRDIIASVKQQNPNLPTFNRHIYDILESSKIHEPYFPPFQVNQIHFDEEASFNISPSGLTKSFGRLAEVFMKEEGILENAFLHYQKENYANAEAKLLSILPSPTELGDKATLLLAWTKFKRLQYDAALVYAKVGFKAQHPTIALESFYLAYLILLKSQSWQQIVEIHQQYSLSRDLTFWDARVSLMQLLASYSQQHWEAITKYLKKEDLPRFAHSKYYHKFHEIAGIAYFMQKNYSKSLHNTQSAQKMNPDLGYRKKLNRSIAWQYYFLNKHSNTIDLIERSLPFSLIDDSDEIHYLLLASFVKQKKWQLVKKTLNKITKSSVFYKYAAFLIQMHAVKSQADPGLLTSIKGIHYDFPEMVFKSGLQNGNRYFKTDQFKDAERSYLQALSADVTSSEYHLALYNLGLTHLKLRQYEKARRGFVDLLLTLSPKDHHRIRYHLLYTLYHLNRGRDYLKEIDNISMARVSKGRLRELQFMKASILLSMAKYADASKIFFQLWKQAADIEAFESGISALYHQQKYEDILTLLKKKNTPKTDALREIKIRSLLDTQRARQAQRELSRSSFTFDYKTDLMLDVWLANQLYKKVITESSKLLGRSLDGQKRLLLYLSLGSSHFYLKQYTASKNQFYKALKTTTHPQQSSAIQYNMALVAYYSKDYRSFVKETKLILAKKTLAADIRYTLTELLVNYYQQINQFQKADAILVSYIADYPYRRAEVKIKRIELHYNNQSYSTCFKLADKKDEELSLTQHRDRLLLYGYCGNHINKETDVVKRLKMELSLPKTNYRLHEVKFVLAQSYFTQGNFVESHQLATLLNAQTLEEDIKKKTQILLVSNLVKLKEFDTADLELGDPNRFRETRLYPDALILRAEIDFVKGRPNNSIKTLLRHYYLPKTSEHQKIDNLLRICEILVEFKRISEAAKYWTHIDEKKASKDSATYERYQKLARHLHRTNS